MTRRQAVCLVACTAAALSAAAEAHAAASDPCVGTGVLATLAPGTTVPVIVGPSVSASERQSATADSFLDPASQLTLDHVDVGAAGCVGAAGAPGGTAMRATVWRLLGNSVGADTVEADLVPAAGDGSGWRLRARFDGLEVNAQPVTIPAGATVPVGAWGVLRSQVSIDAGPGQPLRWWRAALGLRLTEAHAGFAAGTTFLIGWVSAGRRPAPPPKAVPPPPAPTPKPKPPTTTTSAINTTPTPTTTGTTPTTTTPAKPKVTKAKQKKQKKPRRPRGYHPTRQPLRATPPLGAPTYVFPVTGAVDWGDTYGADRSDVPGGWHHGDDLFAKLGTPVVAVADGTVFAVGWNRVGGWRLWLRDRLGNAFYYAHLSGYTALARNNGHVRQGEVLGFVGNTGDAFTTDPHLHFEVHPNTLLFLGYDGAVDPTTYLAGWRRLDAVKILPPVVLPPHAHVGQGSITDYRRLLALHPLVLHPLARTQRPPKPLGRLSLGGHAVSATAVQGGSGSAAALVAGGLLLLLAASAVGLTAWNGRAR